MSNYRPYPSYKNSGSEWVGAVPEHWDVKRLKFIASLNPAPNWTALETQQDEYPFIPMEAISETGEIDTSRRKSLTESRKGYTYFAEGDVVFAKVTPCFENGKGAIIEGLVGSHGFGTTELTVLRPRIIDRDYLYALTYADFFRGPGASEMLGSGGLKRVPDEFVRNFRIPVPPRQEQLTIAGALRYETARLDTLIAKKIRFIELLQEKRLSLITQLVTKGTKPQRNMKNSGSPWIGEVPASWTACNLGFVATLATGGTPDRQNPEYWSGDIPWIKTGEINYETILKAEEKISDSGLSNSAAYIAEPGTILMAMYGMGVTRGRVAILGIPATFNQACAAILCGKKIYNWYLYYCLVAAYRFIRDLGNEASQVNLNLEIISKIKVPIPASIEEQKEIVSNLEIHLDRIRKIEEAVSRSVDLLKERRSALITAAVTGQIDLRKSV